MSGNRLVVSSTRKTLDTWLASRLSSVVHRSQRRDVVYFFSSNVDVLVQLGYIRINSGIHIVAVLANTDQMLDMMAAAEMAGSVLPDQVIILAQDDEPGSPEVFQGLYHWQLRNADYLVHIGNVVPDDMLAMGFPIIHINPNLKEVNWIINGKLKPFV